MSHQISEFELARFARGSASAAENRRIVAHLLAGCPACGARLGSFLTPRSAPAGAYDAVFSRLERRFAAAEAETAGRERAVAGRA
jgi:hypothetical protein